MADEKTSEQTVYTGTVKNLEGDGERTVRIVEAPKSPKKYPFGWGIVAFAPSLFAPVRRPLFHYDLLLVGLPTAQSRVLAYLMRRQVAERLMGNWRIPMPPWPQVAWELGLEAKAARRAFAALTRLRVVEEVGRSPRLAVVSPFVHYVGSMDMLRARWQQLFKAWTPEQDAWDDFWASAPTGAQVAKAARKATEAGSADPDDSGFEFPEEWGADLGRDGPWIDHSLDPNLMPTK